MSFENTYTNPKLTLNHANEFTEGKTTFVYSVGYAENGPVVVKSNEDGTTVWEKVLQTELKSLRLERIVQTSINKENNYVISAFDGHQRVLLSIDPNGNLIWIKTLGTYSGVLNTFLLPAKNGAGFYFIYSYRSFAERIELPIALKFDVNGTILLRTRLDVSGVEKRGLVLNAAKFYESGLILAGELLENESLGVIFNLDVDLRPLDTKLITSPGMTIQDVLAITATEYLISAYSLKEQTILLSRISVPGTTIYSTFPETRDSFSLLTLGKGRFYLSVKTPKTALVHRVKLNMQLDWTKQLTYKNEVLAAKTMEFSDKTKHLTATTTETSCVLHTDEELTTCIAKEITTPDLRRGQLTVKKVDTKFSQIDIKQGDLKGTLVDIRTTRVQLCDDKPCVKDEKICALYAQMLAAYRDCFTIVLSKGEKPDYPQIAKCAETLLAILINFHNANPSYNLEQHLKSQIGAIQDFMANPNAETYELADAAILEILDYLLAIGNCDCGEGGLVISDAAFIQSAHLYLQSAGSVGDDSTKGIHLRWMLRGGLAKHLPKANYAIPGINFNKNDDFVRIYRAKYAAIKTTLNLTVAPNVVNDASSQWLYAVGAEMFKVRFANAVKYAQVRTSIDPSINPTGFIAAYGSEVIEIENENQLSFAVTLYFAPTLPAGTVDLELRSVVENTISAPKKASLRKSYAVQDLSGTQVLSENIRSARFLCTGTSIQSIEFEFYAHFITEASKKNNWEYLGKHALTKNTSLAFSRLEPQPNSVDGNWLRYNDDAYVKVDNYKARWNSPSVPLESQIITTVDRYIDLSNSPTNADAIELIYFNDPSAAPIPGYEPDPDFDPSENQFELSNLFVLQLASLDYHVARMLGLGVLDLDNKLNNNQRFVYLAEYVSYGDLQDGLGAREVQHAYCSLPTALQDQRLPLPVDLKPPVPGIFQDLGTEAPSLLTDADGYTVDGKTRFLSLFHEELPDEDENAAFFYKNYEFVSSEGTIPVYAGIEYKLTSDPDWVKPELPHDKTYFNIDITVVPEKRNETRSIVLPDMGYPVFVHREKQSGWHDYSSYGINWFSRATSSPVIHSIETVIAPTNNLQPPTNINAVLIRAESPLFLTSADEQVAFAAITTTDKTFIRLTFDYNHGQELIDYHKEINGEEVSGYFELPDNEELFAEDIDIYFRNEIPNSVSGKVLSVADDSNPILSVITTDEYILVSQGGLPDNVLIPEIPVGLEPNFIGSLLSIEGVNYIIHQIDNSGTYPVFKVFKNNADGFPVDLSTSIPAGDLTAPTAGGLFIIVENMLTPASWNTPNPLSFKVNIDHTTIHTESVIVHVPDGTNETHVQKFRGIYEDALIEKVLEDDDGDIGTPDVHLGLYKLTFTGFSLAQHSQAASSGHRVEWFKGVVRVHTTNFPTRERKALHVIRTENIGTMNDLVIYAVDPTFDTDPSYDEVGIGTLKVNYYPGYKTYLNEDTVYGLTETNILPGPDEEVHYSIFGFRSNDWDLGFHSKISVPVLMYAQKIEEPLQPRIPVGAPYTTRPDFFGKSTYTFTNIYEHKPYSVQFKRASDIQILTALWRKDDIGAPGAWTIARIKEEIFEDGNADWYVERWQNLLGFDYTYTADPTNDGNLERFPDAMGTSLPLPNSEVFIASINVFIDNHNLEYGTSVPHITAITSMYQVIIPASAQNAQLQAIDFVQDVVYNCFVPLTEIPVIYQHIKGLTYKPIPKKQVVRDENNNLLNPSDTRFDMAPMMKIVGPDPSIPTTEHQTQFTDFGIDGASNAKYFYVAREMNLQMKNGPHSPILGPINLVNTAPPKAPEIVKITPILENRAFGISPQIEIQLNGYVKNQNIKKINVYRTLSAQNALSIRTMDLVNVVEVDVENIQGDAIWKVKDDFGDLGYVPYGDPLFYMLTVSREVKYNDKDNVLQTEYQPSEVSKLTITNIVENYNPDAPVLSYYSDPIDASFELHNVTFRWPKTVHNGSYAIQKRNEKGNWVTIHSIQTNADEITVALANTDVANGTLATVNADGNTVYHIFKIVATNFAGMISRDEKILSIYELSTWNDIAGL